MKNLGAIVAGLIFMAPAMGAIVSVDCAREIDVARCEYNTASVNLMLGNFAAARERFEFLLSDLRARPDSLRLQLNYQLEIGEANRRAKRFVEALASFQESRRLATVLKDLDSQRRVSQGTAWTYSGIGDDLKEHQQYRKSIYWYEQSLEVAATLNDKTLVRELNASLAQLYFKVGKLGAAAHSLQTVQQMLQDNPNENWLEWFRSIGLGLPKDLPPEQDLAPQILAQLKQDAETVIHDELARTLVSLSAVYSELGEYDKGILAAQQAFEVAQGRITKMSALGNLGATYAYSHQYAEATSYTRRAAEYAETLQNQMSRAQYLNNLGRIGVISGGDIESAITLYTQALAIVQGGNSIAQAIVQINLADAYYKLGRYDAAVNEYGSALLLAEATGDLSSQWRVYAGLQECLAAQGRNTAAIFWGKKAVNALQSMRSEINLQLGIQVSDRFVSERPRQIYSDLAHLLARAGRIPEAEQVMALLKKHEFFEFTRGSVDLSNEGLPFTPGERTANQIYNPQPGEVVRLIQERQELVAKDNAGSASEDEKTRLRRVKSTWEAHNKAFRKFVANIPSLAGRSDAQRERQKTVTDRQNLIIALGIEGPTTAALQYIASGTQLDVIITTSEGPLFHSYSIPREKLFNDIAAFRAAILKHDSLAPQNDLVLKTLSDELLPLDVQQELTKLGIKTLLLFLDSEVRLVPFAALLQSNGKYLIEDYQLVLYPEGNSVTTNQQHSEKPWEVDAFGLTEKWGKYRALTAVASELNGIVQPDVLPGNKYLNETFTIDQFETTLKAPKPVIHIASHFELGLTTEESFLLVHEGKQLTLGKLINGGFRMDNVELLTLSACQTAVETRLQEYANPEIKNERPAAAIAPDADGSEIESLASAMLGIGARAVLGTLWPIEDSSTGQLMKQFYQGRQKHNLSKVEALRQAQLTLLHQAPSVQPSGPTSSAAHSKTADYTHPYYWAGFVLSGNWH